MHADRVDLTSPKIRVPSSIVSSYVWYGLALLAPPPSIEQCPLVSLQLQSHKALDPFLTRV